MLVEDKRTFARYDQSMVDTRGMIRAVMGAAHSDVEAFFELIDNAISANAS